MTSTRCWLITVALLIILRCVWTLCGFIINSSEHSENLLYHFGYNHVCIEGKTSTEKTFTFRLLCISISVKYMQSFSEVWPSDLEDDNLYHQQIKDLANTACTQSPFVSFLRHTAPSAKDKLPALTCRIFSTSPTHHPFLWTGLIKTDADVLILTVIICSNPDPLISILHTFIWRTILYKQEEDSIDNIICHRILAVFYSFFFGE